MTKSTRAVSTSGYRLVGKEYEHRIVLRAVIGGEPHPCTWCSRILTWGVDLHVDHLDYDKLNNDPHNLVPSCQPCNNRRSRHWRHNQTHCIRGHEFTDDNTGRSMYGFRSCRTCHREACRRYHARLSAERNPLPRPPRLELPPLEGIDLDQLVTATQASGLLLGVVTMNLICAWRAKGRIVERGRNGPRAVYRLGDIVDVERRMAELADRSNNHRARRRVDPAEKMEKAA